MQFPRRTSEFQEVADTATKRTSRSTQLRQSRVARPPSIDRHTVGLPNSVNRGSRTTPQKQAQLLTTADAPGTANKYSSRASRIARTSSLERLANSALRGSRTTPQKTPTSITKPTTRVLFTAEKQRNAHNDKKWVQERAQQITEHLFETAHAGSVHGLSSDFFARSGCLRQISTKQFVGIVNHFLQYIWGTRFTVGSNYIDDIVNILQKLKYPYQINKSWLKTPNTSHSFGYVIQLLDFLMDFVPPQNEEEASDMKFEFEDPQELSQSSLMHESPDADFTALILQNSEEGFMLWDKQMDDELHNLQEQTCDVLIYKRCGLQGISSLDAQLHELKLELQEEQKKRPHIRKEDEEHCLRLEKELKETQQQVLEARETLEISTKKISEMQAEEQRYKAEFMELLEKVNQMKGALAKQTLSVAQRDAYIEELEQRKYTLQRMERTLRDLEGRQHHQQVLVSRHKKQLTDKIAKYNDHIRAISCTKLQCDAGALQLPLNPQLDDVKKRIKMLEETRERAQKRMQQIKQKQQELEKQGHELNHEITSSLRPKCAELETALKLAERNSREFAKYKQKQSAAFDAQLQELDDRLQKLQVECKILQDTKREKQIELVELEKQNEELIVRTEHEYKVAADGREAFLNDYEKALDQSNKLLVEFAEEIQQREIDLQRIAEEEGKK
ncbi:trichohyalin-like [Anastrepha obliqua]|uniref:trichohyalin-like n=1 Tax=Anastrepha obliqua TaxID=95512 RepID=UPI00240A2DE9|nr:trichohyalin-like [Anastrepha obliqua]